MGMFTAFLEFYRRDTKVRNHFGNVEAVVVLAFFVSQVAPIALYPILGAGILTICIGAGLLIGARVVAEAHSRELPSHSPR